MEVARTPVDNTPLLVNLLRLIRDARSPNYKDHEKGPVTFHFGGLCMRDSGGYTEAEELWRTASFKHHHGKNKNSGDGRNSPFRGPIHLAVYLNHFPVEVWTLQDFRDPTTEHSVPRDFEQLEQLNTLVRVLFAHLRSQEIYSVVLQSCVTTTDDVSVTQTDIFDEQAVSSTLSPLMREGNASGVRGPHSLLNHVSLRLFENADDEDGPRIPTSAQRQYLWSSEDFVRVDAVANKAWRYHTAPQVSAFPATTTDVNGGLAQARSSPIKTNSNHASRTQTGDDDVPSPSTSPEVTGSLAKSSLPTPHLAPTGTSSPSINRLTGVSPTSRISPLFLNQHKLPMLALSDFALPPPELSELVDGDLPYPSRSSPLGPRNPSIFNSVVGNPAGKSNAVASPTSTTATTQSGAMTSTVGHLEDVMWLSNAMHVHRMGTLVSGGKDGIASPTPPFSSQFGTKQNFGSANGELTSYEPTGPRMGSLLATASIGALSGLDLDSTIGWSGAELDDLDDDDALGEGGSRDVTAGNSPSGATTAHLMSLLVLCSSVKLHHVAPAPFGDLVIALNLKDSPT